MERNRNPVSVTMLVVLSLFLAANLLPSATQAACVPPPSGLINWWPGDGNANDIVGGENAILDAGATTAPGFVGGAFNLNGVSASVPTPLILPPVGTIECWVKFGSPPPPSSDGDVWPIGGTHGTANGGDRLWIVALGPSGYLPNPGVPKNSLVVNLGASAVNDIMIPNPLVQGSWKHIALTFNYNSDVYQLYVDGVLLGSSTTARAAPTQPYRIGGVSSDFGQFFFFPGMIDEVSIYDRLLSTSEIKAIFNAGSAGKCKLPDTDGDGINDTEDSCPSSNLSATVVIGGCDSLVLNTLFPNGCTLSDTIQQCVEGAKNHGEFVSCVSHLMNELKGSDLITGRQHGAIQSCAAQSEAP